MSDEQLVLRLPEPTGKHPIGVAVRRLVDDARPDPWLDAQPCRELMVSIWYPSITSKAARAEYVAAEEAAQFDVWLPEFCGLPAGRVAWPSTVTNARTNPPADTASGPYPILLMSSKYTGSRTHGTILAEELASRGYLVVAVDHTYEAHVVEFPGGRLERSRIDGSVDMVTIGRCLECRVRDMAFLLDKLRELHDDPTGSTLPAGLTEAMDLSKVGAVGHSLGGATAIQLAHEDTRLHAVVNLDGGVFGTVAHATLGKPLLQFYGEDFAHPSEKRNWRDFRRLQDGNYRELRLRGSRHHTFWDLNILIRQCAASIVLSPDKLADGLGTIDAQRAFDILRTYVTAFFDHHLKGIRGALLDGPSADFPEIEFTG